MNKQLVKKKISFFFLLFFFFKGNTKMTKYRTYTKTREDKNKKRKPSSKTMRRSER